MRPLPLGSTKCVCCNDKDHTASEAFRNFETRTMTETQLNAFLDWYDLTIDTEREINSTGFNEYYVVCFDLIESDEMKVKVRCKGMS
jgi:hypothetical protein